MQHASLYGVFALILHGLSLKPRSREGKARKCPSYTCTFRCRVLYLHPPTPMCFETNDSPATGGGAQRKRSSWNTVLTFPPFLEKSLLALTTSSPAHVLTGPGPQGTENPSQVLEEAQEKGTKEKRKRKKERDRTKVESKEERGTTQGKVAEGTHQKTPFTTQPVTGSFP